MKRRERVQALTEGEHAHDHHGECLSRLPSRHEPQEHGLEGAVEERDREDERRRGREPAGDEAQDPVEEGVVGDVRVHRTQDARGDERQGHDRDERHDVGGEDRPQARRGEGPLVHGGRNDSIGA